MSDNENNEIDDLENKEEQILNDDNDIFSKERPSEASKNSEYFSQQNNRFTTIENNFGNPEDESMRPSNISKNDRPSNIFKNNDNNNELNHNENKNSIRASNRKTNSLKNKIEIKIILLGDVSVGKTSIISRYVNNSFTEDYRCSIQAEKKTKLIDVDLNTSVRMNIWDTVGQEKYRNLTRQYYHDCHGAIIVFDITKKDSFDVIQKWIDELRSNGPKNIVIIIVGNKSDLTHEREVPFEDIKNKIGNKYPYYEVSAKNGNNIVLAFDKLRTQILKDLNNNNNDDNDIRYNVNPRDTKELDNLGKSVKDESSKCC